MTLDFVMEKYAPGNQVGNYRFFKTRRSAFVATSLSPWIFMFCNNAGHSTYNCQNFKNLTPTYRLQEIKRLDLCINFLKIGHQASQCDFSNFRTRGSKHKTFLHLGNLSSTSSQEASQSPEALVS